MAFTKLVCVAASLLFASGCTSDVSGDGSGPNLGHSSLIAAFRSGSQIQTLGSDADAVYWIESTGLYRCAKTGCNLQPTNLAPASLDGAPRPIQSSPFAGAASLVVGGTTVYWSTNDNNNRHVYACPTSGCPNGPQAIADVPSTGFAPDLRADASGVYFASDEGGPSPTIVTCPGAGCGNSPRVVVQTVHGNGPQVTFALAGGRLYFWNPNNNGGAPAALPFGLVSCPTSGCTTDVRVHYADTAGPGNTPSVQANVLAADDAAVYLGIPSGTSSGNTLSRCDLPACNGKLQTLSPATQSGNLLNASNGAMHIYQTADALYVSTNQCTGPCSPAPTLSACAKTGCPQGPTTFQPDVTFPLSNNRNNDGNNGGAGPAIAIDASGIYWTGVPSYFEGGSFLLRSPLK